MLKIKGLTYEYAKNHQVLEDISFSAKEGECLAILGNNGVGKSTLLKCINQIIKPKCGEVLYEELLLSHLKRRELSKKIAFVSQQSEKIHLKVIDVLSLGRCPHIGFALQAHDKEQMDLIIKEMKIEGYLDQYLDELSGGEVQRIMIARALIQEPKILLLDEPTSNLDIKHKEEILSLIQEVSRKKQVIVIMVLHDLNLAIKYCDKFIFLKDKKIYEKGNIDIITKENIREVFEVDNEMVEIKGRKIII
ncbi:MAG TPA: ABC transporter ATP-binding protein [Candidatus Dorea intestinavium]|nr:ABC transporter ATP-binding protein [Candidatus Dorea intestinavium]